MSANADLAGIHGPQSVLVVGCGLIGTSFALALRSSNPEIVLDGVEVNADYREMAHSKQVFRELFAELPEGTYDVTVLAVPVDVACQMLPLVKDKASLVMDVCSVKQTICLAAEQAGLTDRFAPTHPMAGLASAGPGQATPELFQDKPWLFIEGWPASLQLVPLIGGLGARVKYLATPEQHDEVMAVVSHAIHVTSLSAMLAYGDAKDRSHLPLHRFTGPAFRDITRLSASPSGFWLSTLLANTEPVVAQVDGIIARLQEFRQALITAQEDELLVLLDLARMLHDEWRGERA